MKKLKILSYNTGPPKLSVELYLHRENYVNFPFKNHICAKKKKNCKGKKML